MLCNLAKWGGCSWEREKEKSRKCTRTSEFSSLNNLRLAFNVSVVAPNGDFNPYFVAVVPETDCDHKTILQPGDALVGNFNSEVIGSGGGTTIMRVTPTGDVSVFFPPVSGLPPIVPPDILLQGFTDLGLITSRRHVVAGCIPTLEGTPDTIQQGSILFLDGNGCLLRVLVDPWVNAPWGGTLVEHPDECNDQQDVFTLFVSNVTQGFIVRMKVLISGKKVRIEKMQKVASGYMFRYDPDAIVVGVAGLAYDSKADLLYVCAEFDNRVFAVRDPFSTSQQTGTGKVIFDNQKYLHGALSLVQGPFPGRHLLLSNSDAQNQDPTRVSELVEIQPQGIQKAKFVAQYSVDTTPGSAFGITFSCLHKLGLRFLACDDASNTLKIFQVLPSRRTI